MLASKEQVMREWILRQVGCGYIYGATGWVCTEARRKQQAAQYPAYADVIMSTGAKWDGKVCYDCAQLTRRGMEQIGLKPPSGATSQFKRADLYSAGGVIGDLPTGRLAQLFRVAADGTVPHTGFAIGDGTTVDARGHKDGVIRMAIDKYPWTHYKIIAGSEEEYMGETAETPDVPETEQAVVIKSVRMRKSTDTTSSANVIREMQTGETVTVLGTTTKGAELWANVEQTIGRLTYRGWACVRDASNVYIDLGGDAVEIEPPTVDPDLMQELQGLLERALKIIKLLRGDVDGLA